VVIALAKRLPWIRNGESKDLAMEKTMSGYWIAFVKTGDPNGGDCPKWPRYYTATRNVMNFVNTGVTFGADPLRARLDLWRTVWKQGR
jgi:para-nitrobenzyl esterase